MYNLECTYCFVKGKNNTQDVLNDNEIIKGIELFGQLSQNSKSPQIILYGGEPTLFKSKLIFTFKNIRKILGEKVKVQLLTNGFNIDEEISRMIKEYEILVSLSIDGPYEMINNQRLSKNSSTAFSLFENAYNHLKKVGIKPALSITVDDKNYMNLKNNTLWLIDKFEIESIGFNLLVGESYNNIEDKKNYVKRATEKMLEIFGVLREKGIYEDRIMRKLEVFKSKGIHVKDCGGRGNQIVLAPDGNIGPCQGYLGDIKKFPLNFKSSVNEVLNNQLMIEWSKNYPLKIKECYDCRALAICGGGCLYNSDICGEQYHYCEERMHIHNTMFIDWAVKDLYGKTILE